MLHMKQTVFYKSRIQQKPNFALMKLIFQYRKTNINKQAVESDHDTCCGQIERRGDMEYQCIHSQGKP